MGRKDDGDSYLMLMGYHRSITGLAKYYLEK